MKVEGKISFGAAVLMSVNIIIGAGIFVHPQKLTALAGSLGFMSWPLAGLLLLPIIWGIVHASRLFPGEGGFCNYCTQGINKTAGFMAQWCYVLGYLGTAATITAVLRARLIGNFGFNFIGDHPYLFNAAVIVFFSLLNLLSIELISKVQSLATLVKLLPLLFVIGVLAWYWNPSITYDPSQALNLGLTLPSAIFAYFGFEACCSIGHMLKGGTQQVGKVVLTAFTAAVLIYMFFHLGLIHIMGVNGLVGQGVEAFPSSMGLSATMTSLISMIVIGCILLSFCNTIFGVSLTNVTNIFTFARQRLIVGYKALTRVNSLDRPTVAVLVHGLVLWGFLALITSITVLNALTVIGVTMAFALTLIAVMLTYWGKKSYGKALLALPGLGSCGILFYYCWIDLSPELLTRFLYITPIIVGVVIGLVLYMVQQYRTAR